MSIDINRNRSIIEERFGIDSVKGSNDEIRYNCPFCEKRRGKEDKDYKLYVNVRKMKFFCFKCGAKGRLGSKVEDSDIYSELSRYFNYKDYENDSSDDEESNMFYCKNIKISENSVAHDYLKKRGISDDLIDFYNIRMGIGETFGRIVVPNIVYGGGEDWTDIYSARSYIDQIPKYKYPEGCKKSKVVFNMHRTKKGDRVRIVEGVITSIAAGKNSICIYGSHPSEEQLTMISDMEYEEVDCVLDNDPAGRSGNLMLADELVKRNKCGKVFMVTMPEGIDAADMGHEEFDKYVRNNRVPFYSSLYGRISTFIKNKEK